MLDHRTTPSITENVDEAIADRPWVIHVVRTGWVAKGVVYALMGLTALTIGRHRPTTDEASPEGALGQVADRPWGRPLLIVLALGLLLYSLWRLLSVVLVRGRSLHDWLDRAGYLFSAGFYTVLAVSALGAAKRHATPEDSNSVEHLSQSLLASSLGRWTLLVAGLVTLGIGLYFVVSKGFGRSFLKELQFEGAPPAERQAVVWSGVVGWIGRGLTTAAVGWFVLSAAWDADSTDARGFDRALRELANSSFGVLVVVAAGVGLIFYGAFCLIGFRHMKPAEGTRFPKW